VKRSERAMRCAKDVALMLDVMCYRDKPIIDVGILVDDVEPKIQIRKVV